MDALEIEEQGCIDFKSKYPGVMHACGHDGHMAMLLGVAKLLSDISPDLNGSVIFCFQPAEEGGAGGQQVVNSDLVKSMDQGQLRQLYREFYRDEPFVRLRQEGNRVSLSPVVGSNYCDIGVFLDDRAERVIAVSVIDNLIKERKWMHLGYLISPTYSTVSAPDSTTSSTLKRPKTHFAARSNVA